ncbi:MAG TPA: hypothetical protein VLA93_22675 [Pyrinomonadaceae bacterium]|nr:hypothetical protein [Pyrinomonadaceae bacterium]
MKILLSALICLATFQAVFAQQSSVNKPLAPDKFDQWGDIQFSDEIVHLDKIANQLKEWRLSIVYLVIYAGERACKDEAKARGIRARDYLLKQDIEPERIVWIDAGWKKNLSVEVWIWPPQFGRPKLKLDDTLKRSKVTIEANCKIKYRGGS